MDDLIEREPIEDYLRRKAKWVEPEFDIVEQHRLLEAADRIEALETQLESANEVIREQLDIREALEAENERLREALQWMVDNDETNEGDEPMDEFGGQSWNEINAYWIEGLNLARAALEARHD